MAQDFADAPGLGDAAHRAKGRLTFENLADRADSRVGQVSRKRFEHAANCRTIALGAAVGSEVGSKEPRPGQSLVIRGIAGPPTAAVARLIPLVSGPQRATP